MKKLSLILLSCKYQQAQADHSLFVKSFGNNFTTLIVYVDDIVLTGNSVDEMDSIKKILDDTFRIKNLGTLKYFLGLKVAYSEKRISLLLSSKPCSTPMDSGIGLHEDSSQALSDVSSYRRLVGRLLYVTTTRLDITFATQQLSQFMARLTHTHFQAVRRMLRYLKSCPSKGLFFHRDSPIQLIGFSDADWGCCVDTRRSITGYCFFIGQSLISWKAKKQSTVSWSSSEAEYRALASSTCELQWLTYLLGDLKVTCT